MLNFVGVTRFELATPRPPDVYSNRAELHPELSESSTGVFIVRFRTAKIIIISENKIFRALFLILWTIFVPQHHNSHIYQIVKFDIRTPARAAHSQKVRTFVGYYNR